jgi:hypothetical protein
MAETASSTTGITAALGAGTDRDPVRASAKPFQSAPDKVYMNRARDSNAPGPNAVYVTWVTVNEFASDYPGSPPYGGPLVDRVHWLLTENG